MLYITRQIKALFSMFILNGINGLPESGTSNEVNDSKENQSDILTISEEQKNIIYIFNEDDRKDPLKVRELQKTLKDIGLKSTNGSELGVDGVWGKNTKSAYEKSLLIIEFQDNLNASKSDVIYNSIQEKIILKEGVEKNIKFDNTLKLGSKGEDVKLLQRYLGIEADGVFGRETKKTLRKFQNENKNEIGIRGGDGVMDLDGKTMTYIVNDINSRTQKEISDIYKDVQNGPEANDVVDSLTDVKTYLKAFNEIYGGKGDTISTHNGVLGAVMRMNESELSELHDELSSKFGYVEDSTKEEFAKNLGLEEHSEKYENGLRRMGIIALLSVVLSGGSSIALELFAINFGEDYSKGPEMEQIIKSLTGKEIKVEKQMESMYLSEKTTPQGIEEIFDILNDSEMDTANMRRYLEEIFQLNWFQKLFKAFIPDDYKEIKSLIDKFQNAEDVESGDSITRELHSKFKELTEKIKEKIVDLQIKLKEQESILAVDEDILEFTDRLTTASELEETITKDALSQENLAKVGEIAGRVQNLKAKKEQILGIGPDLIGMRLREKELDNELGLSKFNKISTKELSSEQSYGRKVDTSRLQEKGYMKGVLDSMKTETINGDTSILSGVIRGIEQHYAISFTVEEFEKAYLSAEKVDNKETISILSNTGRDHAQKFQGKIGKGELFKINLNGTPVYFKDECNNIVTVIKDFDTTALSTESIPVPVTFGTNGLLGDGGKGSESGHTATSNPISDNVVDLNNTGPTF